MALKIIKRKEIKPVENQQKELTDKEKASRRGKASKRKGATFERKIAKVFKGKYNVDLVRTPQSGGFAKKSSKASDFRGDITCLDESIDFKLHIECKDQKTLKIRDWVQQAESDCPQDRVPVVIFHLAQVIKEGKVVSKSGDYVTLRLDDFLELVDKETIIKEV